MYIQHVIIFFTCLVLNAVATSCPSGAPATMANFEPAKYHGMWYVIVIGRGWYSDIDCATEEFSQKPEHTFLYSASWRGRYYGSNWVNSTGTLALDSVDSAPYYLSPRNTYYNRDGNGQAGRTYRTTVVNTDYASWALEYSCGVFPTGMQQMYTIRSRTPTLAPEILNTLSEEAESWGINLQTPLAVNHSNCLLIAG